MNSTHRSTKAALVSLVLHFVVVCGSLAVLRHPPVLPRPLRQPGAPSGKQVLLVYPQGGSPSEGRPGINRVHVARKAEPKVSTHTAPPQPTTAAAPATDAGSGSSGLSTLGQENVRIALPAIHPRPAPDLSTLPHGTAGDVVVDVVIDQTGRVTDTTLVKGLGSTVDSYVMQALRDWTFTPATRNGTPIPSEQEILIHYERG